VSRHRGPALRVAGVLTVVAIIILAAAAIATALRPPGDLPGVESPGAPSSGPSFAAGMLHLEYQVMPLDGVQPGPGEVEAVAGVLRARIDPMGTVDPSVTVDGDRVVVDLAVPADDASVTVPVRALLGATGRLEFVPLGDTPMERGQPVDLAQHPPLFSGDQVAGAAIGSDQAGQPTVDITLRPDGAALLAAYTAQHIGEYFAIVMDGTVISAPVIMSAIPEGEVQITQGGTGGNSLDDTQRLVMILESGQLPFPLQEVASNLP
jgi:preprotein translocase subunit SecD